MNVKQLIKELKTMPQDVDVHVALPDNQEYETVGYVCSLFHFIKKEFYDEVDESGDCQAQCELNSMPEECVILRC